MDPDKSIPNYVVRNKFQLYEAFSHTHKTIIIPVVRNEKNMIVCLFADGL